MTLIRSTPAGVARPDTRRQAVGGVLLAVLLLAGCAPDNTPKAYDDQVKVSFLNACTGGVIAVDGVTTTSIAGNRYCGCAYQAFVDNVPYNDDDRTNRLKDYPQDKPTFFALNNDLKDDANKIDQLSDDVKNKLKACSRSGEDVTGGSVPNGTTPPGTSPRGTTPGSPGTTAPATTSGSAPA